MVSKSQPISVQPARPAAPVWQAYVLAVGTVALAAALSLALGAWAEAASRLFYLLAAIAAAWFGGRRAGLVASVLGALGLAFTTLEPAGQLRLARPGPALVEIGLMLAVAGLASLAVAGRHLNEVRIKASRRQLQELADALPALIAYIDARHIYRFNNEAYERWFDLPRGQIVGCHMRSVIGEAAYEVVRPYLEQALAGQVVTYETEVPYRSGEGIHPRFIRATYTPARNEQGQVTGCYVLVLDRTAEHAVEVERTRLLAQTQAFAGELESRVQARTAELRASQQRLQLLIDSVQDYAIFMLDLDGRVVSWNPAARRMLGYPAEEVLGHSVARFYTPEDVAAGLPARLAQQAAEHGRAEDEGWRVRHDGSRLWANSIISAVRGDGGELVGFAKITRDLTRRRASEEALHASREQLRALAAQQESTREQERTRIAREIHEELGQQLTGLRLALAQLRRELVERDTRATPATAGVPPLLNELNGLVDDTIRMVRRIAHDLRPAVLDDFGLEAALEWQLEEFERRTGLPGSFQCNTDVSRLDPATATALFRIFQEALTNVARHAQATAIEVVVEQDPGHVVLRVSDDGRGFDLDSLSGKRTFGLAGMRERARLLGGELAITGRPGRGTSVVVRIPCEERAPAA